MADTVTRTTVPPEALAAMRQGEVDTQWLQEHPEVLAPYRGQ